MMKASIASLMLVTLLASASAWAADDAPPLSARPSEDPAYAVDDSASETEEAAEEIHQASATTVRRFHEVFDELLAEFGYDVKTGQLAGLKNVAIRRVEVSDAIPATYREYTSLLISERIRENSQVRIIHCLPCSAKTSKLVEGKIMITSPSTNIGELKAAADSLGIDNFVDIVLVYHATHMVLGVEIFKADTHETVWARTYNSETIRSRYQKLAIDYSQVAKARPSDEYQPEYRLLLGVGGSAIPNIGGDTQDSSMVNLQVRSTEKFDNRRSEFGLMASFYLTLSGLLSDYPKAAGTGLEEGNDPTRDAASNAASNADDFQVPAAPQPFSFALGVFAIYSHNFLGSVESYDEVRQGVHLGLGSLLTVGYLGPTVKAGWDVFFGRRFALALTGVYILPSQIFIDSEPVPTKGGGGAEVVLSFNY